MVMERINTQPQNLILKWHLLGGSEKAFESAVDPQTSSLEVALIPVGRLKNVKIAWHLISRLLLLVALGGLTSLVLQLRESQ